MEQLSFYIKSILESKKDKVPVNVFNYLTELSKSAKNKDVKDAVEELLADAFYEGEFQYDNQYYGNPSDKPKCKDDVENDIINYIVAGDGDGWFVIVNPDKDFFVTVGCFNKFILHCGNNNIVKDDPFKWVTADIYRGGGPDPASDGVTISVSPQDFNSKEDEYYECNFEWYDELYEYLAGTFGEISAQLIAMLDTDDMQINPNKSKLYNKYKNIINDKNTFICLSGNY